VSRAEVDTTGVVGQFDVAAATYDRLVGANPGYHRLLRSAARRLVDGLGWIGTDGTDGTGLRLLDLGCGTGASTAALLGVAPNATIVGVDGSAGMLGAAREKSWPANVAFVQARAEDLPAALAEAGLEQPFDGILAAYLVRNVAEPDRDAMLASLTAVLRPGGRLAVVDYALTGSLSSRLVWTAVCHAVVMPLVRLTRGPVDLYGYLWHSALAFDRAPELATRLERCGLTDVEVHPGPHWQHNVAATVLGRMPAEAAP